MVFYRAEGVVYVKAPEGSQAEVSEGLFDGFFAALEAEDVGSVVGVELNEIRLASLGEIAAQGPESV